MATPNLDKIMASIELLAKEKKDKQRKIVLESQSSIEMFFAILVEIKPFLKYFKRINELGYNVTEIVTQIKLVFADFIFELVNLKKIFVEKDKIKEIIESNISKLNNEWNGLSFIESKFSYSH